MNKTLTFQKYFLAFVIPALLVGMLLLMVNTAAFKQHPKSLAFGVTFDLLLTIPIIYFLLIRKTNIPKTSVIAVLVVGVALGSTILPIENQQYLTLFKTWMLPAIELTILLLAMYNLKKGIKAYKQNKVKTNDAFLKIKMICNAVLPNRIASFLAFEIAAIYYGFIHWKKLIPKKNTFTYHKNSGTIATLGAFIFLIGIETFAFHILLVRWNLVAAWVFTFLSIYTAIQIFGFLKSMSKRPISIDRHKVYLYYGIINDAVIDIEQIDSIEMLSKEITYNSELRKFSFMDSPNVIISLKKQSTFYGFYGIKKTFKSLAIYVDDPTAFKAKLESSLQYKEKIKKNL